MGLLATFCATAFPGIVSFRAAEWLVQIIQSKCNSYTILLLGAEVTFLLHFALLCARELH